MSSESPLDAEELENVPLVRMEDVQPDRSVEKVSILYSKENDDSISNSSQDCILETFIVDGSELHCVVDNDDSNIGSMVSIQSEETLFQKNELIVPEVLEASELVEDVDLVEPIEDVEEIEPIEDLEEIEPIEDVEEIEPIEDIEEIESVEDVEEIEPVEDVEEIEPVEEVEPIEDVEEIEPDVEEIEPDVEEIGPSQDVERILIKGEPNIMRPIETPMAALARKISLLKTPPPDSWPTLEILPGGVINLAEKADNSADIPVADKNPNDVGEMIYACAKCSQGFKYLFCLVKHVRWHEEEAQKLKLPTTKLTPIEKKMADLQERSEEMDKIIKNQKGIVDIKSEPKRKISKHTVDKLREKYICLHSGKRKIIQKPKVRRAPKKS